MEQFFPALKQNHLSQSYFFDRDKPVHISFSILNSIMVVHTHLENNTFKIELTGELDACSSILVDRVIVEAIARHPQQIIVNCKNLTYISSAGLGMFMSYIQKLSSENIHLVLHSLNSTIRNIFNIMGLDELIPIVPSEKAAYAFCNKKNMLVNITSNGD